jgi:hypothetical protein
MAETLEMGKVVEEMRREFEETRCALLAPEIVN